MSTPSIGIPVTDVRRLLDELAAARAEIVALRRVIARNSTSAREEPPPELRHAWHAPTANLPVPIHVVGREVVVIVDGPPREPDPAREAADWAVLCEAIRRAMAEG